MSTGTPGADPPSTESHGPPVTESSGTPVTESSWAPVEDRDLAGRLLTRLLCDAAVRGARTIHLQPIPGQGLVVRLRGASGLAAGSTPTLPPCAATPVVQRLKGMAGLAQEERRVPQEGTFLLAAGVLAPDAPAVSVHVATLPSTRGEVLVVDLGHRGDDAPAGAPRSLPRLGLDPADLLRVIAALGAPGGLVLAAAPHGHGDRTLLHACLRHLACDTTRTIFTVDDAAPPDLAGVVSVRVARELGATDAGWLGLLLRSGDADVIHLPRLRDHETSGALLDAAARGLLALGATPTDDAASALVRLLDLGHPPYLVAAGLSLVVASRVLRRLCDACKLPAPPPDPDDRRRLAPRLVDEELLDDWHDAFAPRRGGCAACGGTGHAGRVGVYEVLSAAGARLDEVSRAHGGSVDPASLRATVYQRVRTLRERALLEAADGRVSLVDALRHTPCAPGGAGAVPVRL